MKVGRIDGEFILNPTISQMEESDLFLNVAGTHDAITMVEGEGDEVEEKIFLDAIDFAHDAIKKIIELEWEFHEALSKPDREWTAVKTTEEIEAAVVEFVGDRVNELITIAEKTERRAKQKELATETLEALAEEVPRVRKTHQVGTRRPREEGDAQQRAGEQDPFGWSRHQGHPSDQC